MNDLAAILRSGLLPKLGMEPALAGGIQGWLLTSTYVPEAQLNNVSVALNRTAYSRFVRAVNYDFERFALAAKETFANALSEHQKYPAVGWPLLKLYYASFFSAHAIMRSRGAGVSQLIDKHTNHVTELMALHNPNAPSLTSGTFVFNWFKGPDDAANELSVMLTPQISKNSKGVHDSFWKEFCRFLEQEAEKAVANREPESSLFLALATELSDAIKSGPQKGAWLSAMRNEINYQHAHDTWAPYKRSSEAYKSISSNPQPSAETVQVSTSKEKTPIKAFIHITCYITLLGIDIGNFVASRSTRGQAFGQKWRRLSELVD